MKKILLRKKNLTRKEMRLNIFTEKENAGWTDFSIVQNIFLLRIDFADYFQIFNFFRFAVPSRLGQCVTVCDDELVRFTLNRYYERYRFST